MPAMAAVSLSFQRLPSAFFPPMFLMRSCGLYRSDLLIHKTWTAIVAPRCWIFQTGCIDRKTQRTIENNGLSREIGNWLRMLNEIDLKRLGHAIRFRRQGKEWSLAELAA